MEDECFCLTEGAHIVGLLQGLEGFPLSKKLALWSWRHDSSWKYYVKSAY